MGFGAGAGLAAWRLKAVTAGVVCTRFCVAGAMCIPVAYAQERLPSTNARLASESGLASHRQISTLSQPELDDHTDVRLRTQAIAAGGALAVAIYGRTKWWQDGFSTRFHAASEGWFGQNTYSGGADKLGHFFMNYAGTRLLSSTFEWAGNRPDQALSYAAGLTLGIFTAVEILDGFSHQWTFSKEDAIMNAAGVGAALLLERNPQLDRVLDLRLLYQPSRENRHRFDPFGDYAGQTYLLVAKASGIPALRRHPFLRYVEFAVGYGARGYSSVPSATGDHGARQLYAGISINLSEVLETTLFGRQQEPEPAQQLTKTFLEFAQVPGTSVFARHTLRGD